ncbi:MAG: homocysteine S-methyltransferase family protein [Pseudomonadota bacterium]
MITDRSIVLMDGGMGQELVRRSGEKPTPLWSAQIMLERPELVSNLHRDFAEAGAEILILNAYAATRQRMGDAGIASLFETVQRAAIDLAEQARRAVLATPAGLGRRIRLAGCLPPLVASYRPDLTPAPDEMLASYREIVALQGPHVDLMLCETMSSVQEAVAATTAGVEAGLETWCAVTVDDRDGTRLRSGEALVEVLSPVRAAGASALLINCSRPEAVSAALRALGPTDLATGGYANAFAKMDTLGPGKTVEGFTARIDMGPEVYADHVMDWIGLGATIVGGCCEVGPDHIATIAQRLSMAHLPQAALGGRAAAAG